jgi:hypothetical protein
MQQRLQWLQLVWPWHAVWLQQRLRDEMWM